MKNSSLSLFLEINNTELIFFVEEKDEQNNYKITNKQIIPIIGVDGDRGSVFDKIFPSIKENIYKIEQELNHTFKEIVLILENFEFTFLNLSGYKKLNGSQIMRENITYILNILKSYINEIEIKKKVLHIFNSKFCLDNKKIENLPIGLFGDFYSHELSLVLINSNDHKNINNIFENCNIKIKKILLKSFLKGAFISDKNLNTETFFSIKLNDHDSKIFYFENNSLKFEQNFKFGLDIILQDISKVLSLDKSIIKKILSKIDPKQKILGDELVEKEYFIGENFRKIKKKLIHQVALARIEEISDLILHRNINLKYNKESTKIIFLEFSKNFNSESVKENLKSNFSMQGKFEVKLLDNLMSDNMLKTLNKLVHFGWKKEAIPTSQAKKSVISRFFDAIFS